VLTETRETLQSALRWVNRRRRLVSLVRTYRQVLPGDSDFGDPMSTVGISPARVIGRRAGALNQGRLSLLAELSLAVLQVADWIGEDLRRGSSSDELAILFTDVRGYSQWALEAGDEASLEMLRNVDAMITEHVEAHGGQVVKRLGDGTMAIFSESPAAVHAAFDAMTDVDGLSFNGYRPTLRAGVHSGRPLRIGDDFIGVDVNIAARLCEAAPPGEVLISHDVHERASSDGLEAEPADASLRGVPPTLSIYRAVAPSTADVGATVPERGR
jgi:adenylate cyclase